MKQKRPAVFVLCAGRFIRSIGHADRRAAEDPADTIHYHHQEEKNYEET